MTMGTTSKTASVRALDLPTFNLADQLRSDEDIAEYLSQVIADGDPAELAHALGVVARKRGMAQIAEGAGIGREALYKALRPGAEPRFDTIARVCTALGLRIVVEPAKA
jgi:probable addiction module antidote protein